jgi:hypothetical protein
MVRTWPRRILLLSVPFLFVGLHAGCNRDDKLADVPQLRPAAVVAPEQQPPALRPPKGSSAGMTYMPK